MTRLLLVCSFALSSAAIYAQSVNLQIVTKEIAKKIKYTEGQVLSVQGEKSEVDINPWDEDYISISLTLSAQHPERSVAEEDLGHFEYSFENTKDTIFIWNSISAKEESLRSGLQATYTIMIPHSCKVKLNNYFGSAVLQDLDQGIDIKSEFCNLTLKNIKGKVDINTYFGDLIGVMINGVVDIKADRSNVTLSEIEGKFQIEAHSGIVKVFANQSLLDMNISGVKSDVFFYDSNLNNYNFNLKSHLGDVDLPAGLQAEYVKHNELNNIVIRPEGELIGAKVYISVVSGDIMLGSR